MITPETTTATRRQRKACAFNIRTALQNAIAAGLDTQIVDRLRSLSMEISADVDRLNGEE